MRKFFFILSSVFVLAVINYAILEKEQIKASGETVLLALAPVDPRSLIQGDYMMLSYAIERNMRNLVAMSHGFAVISLDSNKVGNFVRVYNDEPLKPGEKLLRFRSHYGVATIVPHSFMFQEGQADLYRNAKYGIFKFSKAGDYLLVGLADVHFSAIQPQM